MARSFSEIVEARIAAGATKLPVFDGTAARLRELLASPEVDVDPLVQLVSREPVLASGVLRLANSSFFGGLSEVRTVREAVMRLGVEQVTRLALLVTQGEGYRVRAAELKPLVRGLWSHAMACALGSQWLAGRVGRGHLAGEAFVAGMLHDIGKLLIVRVIDDLRHANAGFRPAPTLVGEMLRSAHAAHGETLARGWAIPEPYPHVIRHHHEPVAREDDGLMLVVRLADSVCNKLGFGIEPTPDANPAASLEAQALRASEVLVAEFEVYLEDAMAAAAVLPGEETAARC